MNLSNFRISTKLVGAFILVALIGAAFFGLALQRLRSTIGNM